MPRPRGADALVVAGRRGRRASRRLARRRDAICRCSTAPPVRDDARQPLVATGRHRRRRGVLAALEAGAAAVQAGTAFLRVPRRARASRIARRSRGRAYGDHPRLHGPPGARDRQRVHARASACSVGVPADPPPDRAAARGCTGGGRRRADQPLGGRSLRDCARAARRRVVALPRPQHGAARPGEEACLDEQRHRVALAYRFAVEALDREPLRAAGAHVGDERAECGAQPLLVRVAQRDQGAPAALDVEHGLAAEHHYSADFSRGAGAPRFGHGTLLRTAARIGRREDERSVLVAASRSSRRRSTAPPSANCAPPRPSTK